MVATVPKMNRLESALCLAIPWLEYEFAMKHRDTPVGVVEADLERLTVSTYSADQELSLEFQDRLKNMVFSVIEPRQDEYGDRY